MSGRLRLLHVFPSFEPGGAQLRMANIINRVGDHLEHGIMALDANFDASYRIEPARRESGQVRLLPPPPGKGSLGFPLALRQAIRQERPDLLVTYNWGSIDAVVGALLGTGVPVLQNECGGLTADEAGGLKRRRVLARRLVLNRIFGTVVVSSTLLRVCRQHYRIAEKRLHFIRTGVDTNQFRPGRNRELRARLGVGDDTLLFGFLGGFRPVKNLPLMVRAFAAAALPDARLVLFGKGPDEPALRALAAELGAAERIIFGGHVENPAQGQAALDVSLMSSVTEQTPNALLEAMATGLPVICTNVGDSSELLGDPGPPTVVPSNDLDAYVASLRGLAADPERRRAEGEANRKLCLERYSMDRMVREYGALYERAAG